MPVPFKVKAVYDYKSAEPDDLNFSLGQIITVTEEDDADWYTGEYEGAGGKVAGIFPRNFVDRYEPAIPTRPARSAKPTASQAVVTDAPSQPDSTPAVVTQPMPAIYAEPPRQPTKVEHEEEPEPETKALENKPPTTKKPPPVVEKPASSSFRDRIAAFNKPAAAPIAPFKPSGSSTGFIKKPFVAPPPSRNSYVPPPAQAAPAAKIYRREEDPEMVRTEEEDQENAPALAPARGEVVDTDDQPKPTSLKDRIALLQQQQQEQAQRSAEKRKTKKPPPPQRADSADNELERVTTTEAPLTRQETGDSALRVSAEPDQPATHFEEETVGTPEHEVAIPTVVSPPPRELVSDTNDADDSGAADTDPQEATFDEDRRKSRSIKSPPMAAAELSRNLTHEETREPTGEGAGDEAEDTEEDEDPEVRRRRELRERMAKMSGGMGMMGMFGPPGGMPAPSKKPKGPKIEQPPVEPQHEEDTARAPPVPIMALPGMSTRHQQQAEQGSEQEEMAPPTPMDPMHKDAPEDDDYISHQPARTSTDRSGPASPYERGAPPPPPRDVRAPPVVPSIPPVPQSPPGRSNLPPPPPPPTRDDNVDRPDFFQSPTSARSSLDHRPVRQASTRQPNSALPPGAPPAPPSRTHTSDSLASTQSTQEKRMSRAPPVPPAAAPSSPQTRGPPPPPPGQPPNRTATSGSRGMASPGDDVEEESEDEVTEYDGDYDTDIASSAKHKDALKAHNRDSSMEDEETLADEAHILPTSAPTRALPPLPSTNAPRDLPPPPPQASIPRPRPSAEAPRGAPPPIPSGQAMVQDDEEDYDPFKYSAPQHGLPSPPIPQTRAPPPPPTQAEEYDDMYEAPPHPPPPPRSQAPPMPAERAVPPPPPSDRAAPLPPPHQFDAPMMAGALAPAPVPASIPKQSIDIPRSATTSRRSTEQSRPSADFGFMASDLDLSEASLWWAQDNTPPPSVRARTDLLYELESNTTTKRGGKTTVNRDVYVLYMDYSQTTINVSFDPNEPSSASLSQSHQRPPPPPRQDQLESVSHSFGNKIATAASQASGNTVADGSAQGLIWTLLQPFRGSALMPVGNRSFGATVYSNLANASTQQFDEIRAGDIVTFRNAKFAGHKGGLHQKYSMEAGSPGRDHAAVVIDWDGTKKKIRAWEQGRDEKKGGAKGRVREESFRVGDLKSGEVRVWRVMGRSWVGWDSS